MKRANEIKEIVEKQKQNKEDKLKKLFIEIMNFFGFIVLAGLSVVGVFTLNTGVQVHSNVFFSSIAVIYLYAMTQVKEW
jgi:predicted HAD superfamily hydrolase